MLLPLPLPTQMAMIGEGEDEEEEDDAADLFGKTVENMPWASVDEYGEAHIILVTGELTESEWAGRVLVLCDNAALSNHTFDHEFARSYLKKRDDSLAFSISGLSTGLISLLKKMPRSAAYGETEACAVEVHELLLGTGLMPAKDVDELGGARSETFGTRARMLLGRLDSRQQAGTEWRRKTLDSLGSNNKRVFDPLSGVLYEPTDSAIDWPRREPWPAEPKQLGGDADRIERAAEPACPVLSKPAFVCC